MATFHATFSESSPLSAQFRESSPMSAAFGEVQRIHDNPLVPATTTTLGGIIVGSDLLITEEGVLSVDKATMVEADNTRPITSAAVYAEVGNIQVLLETI